MTPVDAVTPGTFPLYVLLDLPAFIETVCMGYQNACVCDGCVNRERKAGAAPAQPWDADPDD